jgi:hypothetical protein
MSEIFKIENEKTSWEAGHASIDISVWLRTETIDGVVFSAKNLKTGRSDSTVFDVYQSLYTGIYLKPYIQNGISGQSYRVRMQVTTNQNRKGDFFLDFTVRDY